MKFEAKIVNVLGEIVWIDARKDVSGNYSKHADIKNISAGIYFLNISINGENYVRKYVRKIMRE